MPIKTELDIDSRGNVLWRARFVDVSSDIKCMHNSFEKLRNQVTELENAIKERALDQPFIEDREMVSLNKYLDEYKVLRSEN